MPIDRMLENSGAFSLKIALIEVAKDIRLIDLL